MNCKVRVGIKKSGFDYQGHYFTVTFSSSTSRNNAKPLYHPKQNIIHPTCMQ